MAPVQSPLPVDEAKLDQPPSALEGRNLFGLTVRAIP